MRRRDFIAGLGSAAVWPLVARAQQGDRMRRIGVLTPFYDKTDISRALADLGWIDGRNLRMDFRLGGVDINRMQALAKELVGLQPDVILAATVPVTAAVQRETRTIPIVFANLGDPVASGLVVALNQPGGNITGFANIDATLGSKWIELLLEIAPGLKRAAILFNPNTAPTWTYMLPSLETNHCARSRRRRDRNGHRRPWARAGRWPCRRAECVRERASRADHIGGSSKQHACGLSVFFLCQRWRFALLRTRPSRRNSSRRLLCRSHSARREARRSPGAASDKI
jgi:ABC transporter substrate binding protein